MTWLNENLIGVPGGRAKIQTPALVVDLDIFERNIAHMAEHAKKHGIELRPHAKTHKSVEIAKRQLAAGALGICCAKLGEAEVLAAGGIEFHSADIAGRDRCGHRARDGAERADARTDRDLRQRRNRKPACRPRRKRRARSSRSMSISIPASGRTGIRPGDGAVALVEQIAKSRQFGIRRPAMLRGPGSTHGIAQRARARARWKR